MSRRLTARILRAVASSSAALRGATRAARWSSSTPGSEVTVDVRLAVPLPFVPRFLRGAVPVEVPVVARRTAVVEKGVLRSYLLNTYTARKLGMKSTHNASRGLAGTPGVGCGNLYLEPGRLTPEEIVADIPAGFYVTSLMGFGTNIVTGDYSRGATGLWIENGQLTHAVEEVTVAGNLGEMLKNVTAIGNDLVFRSAVASPTLRIDGMTVAGE